MADITVVNTKITTLNAIQVLTQTASDEGGAGVAQNFVYTPTGKDNKVCFVFYNKVAFTIIATIAAGDGVFGDAANALTVPATAAATTVVQIETGKYMQSDGTIVIAFDPGNNAKILTADHALTVGVLELI